MTAEGMPHNIKIQRTVFKISASWLCLMPATDLGVRRAKLQLCGHGAIDYPNQFPGQIYLDFIMEHKLLRAITISSLLILSNTHAAYAEAPLSRTYPCMDPRIITSFDNKNPNYHYYEHTNIICNKAQSGCSREAVFNTMTSQMRFIAPTISSNAVKHCSEVTLPIGNPIKTTINHQSYSITNFTLPGHMLYPGKITRRVEETSSVITVRTIGVGIGYYKKFNQMVAPQIWGSADQQLAREIKRKSDDSSYGSLGCQATVNQILQSIKKAGGSASFFKINPNGNANTYRSGNPTSRTDELWMILADERSGGYQPRSNKIMGSGPLYAYASSIISRCPQTAIVSFGVNHTDGSIEYFVQADGTTKQGVCDPNQYNRNRNDKRPWGLVFC